MRGTLLALDTGVNLPQCYHLAMQSDHQETSLTADQHSRVAALLGREPRGLRAIPVADERGEPLVIRVASVVDDKPFPTLYWLVGAELSLRIDRLEAAGWIARLQDRVDASTALQQAMNDDHARHREERSRFLSDAERQLLKEKGMQAALDERGIGGISEPTRIRCLHTWYAAHLVTPNTIGQLVDQLLAEGEYLATD
ncbi:MAG: DUF501 domain-containing protein [Luminiphilus sp.]